jgi:cytidine deaminase
MTLAEPAAEARRNSISEHSRFAVGAAFETADGRVFTGCNIENASYGLTMCAERVALFKALSEGAREFRAVAVVTGAASLTPPCGACRQLLWEFGGDLEVILASTAGNQETHRMKELLPLAFDAGSLR